MNNCGEICNPCPNDLYPIIQDLSEAEVGNYCACSDTFGPFELQSLALPVMKPVQIMSPSPKQQQRKQFQQVHQQERQFQQEYEQLQQNNEQQQEQQQQEQSQQQEQEHEEQEEQQHPRHFRDESNSSSVFSATFTNITEIFSSYSSTSASASTSTTASGTSPASLMSLHRRIGSGIFSRNLMHRRSSSLNSQASNAHRRHRRAASLCSQTTGTIMDDIQTIGSLEVEEKPKFHDFYVLTQQIFRCRISDIWECVHKESGTRYCVKIFDKRTLSYQEEIIMKNEIDMLVRFQHCYNQLMIPLEGLTRLIELRDEPNHAYLIMEYIPDGNLFSRIVHDKNKRNNNATAESSTSKENTEIGRNEETEDSCWTEGRVKRLCYSILTGICSLHSLGICHGDLQPQNIVLDSDESAKIIDFGCSLVVRGDKSSTNMIDDGNYNNDGNDIDHNSFDFEEEDCGVSAGGDDDDDDDDVEEEMIHHRMATIRFGNANYTAPEVLQGLDYNTQADMWSLGVILYFCLSGTSPFFMQDSETDTKKISYKKIYRADYSFPKTQWNHVSRHAKQFISNLLQADPEIRMTAEEALQHRWFLQSSFTSSPASNNKLFLVRKRLLNRARNVFLGKQINKLFGISGPYHEENSMLAFSSSTFDHVPVDRARWKTCPSKYSTFG